MCLAVDGHFLVVIADVAHNEDGFGRNADSEVAVKVGGNTVLGSFLHDGGAEQGLAGVVNNCSAYGNVLGAD